MNHMEKLGGLLEIMLSSLHTDEEHLGGRCLQDIPGTNRSTDSDNHRYSTHAHSPQYKRPLEWNPGDLYMFRECGQWFLLNIHSSHCFSLDEPAQIFLNLLKKYPYEAAYQQVAAQTSEREADEVVGEFLQSQEENVQMSPTISTEITSISLNIAQECNLNCIYCYGRKGTYGSRGFMDEKVGKASIDFFFGQLHDAEKCSIHFFGGEPLLNFRLIEHLVPYALKKAEKEEKKVHFTITTNGTLFTDRIINFLNEHQFSVVISIDGPKEIHDCNRQFADGTGSYDIISSQVEKLLTSRTKGVRARTTVRSDHDQQYYAIFSHLVDMGFKKVHIEPATEQKPCNAEHICAVYPRIAEDTLQHAKEGGYLPFSAFSDVMERIYLAAKRYHWCGAALQYVGISAKGEIYPCHRFIGVPEFTMGTIWDFNPQLQERIANSHVDNKAPCSECWARYYCGGWCIYESYFYNRDITKPYVNRCKLFKTALKLSIWLYSRLKAENSGVFDDMYEKYIHDYIKEISRRLIASLGL